MPGYPPGLVGDIARCVASRLQYELPNIALATALSSVSRMNGNQSVVVAPSGRLTPLNLYALVTAHSGAGKETCRSFLNELGQAVASENLISSNPASPQALGRMLSKGPRTSLLIFQDEFGKKLAHADSGSAAYDAAVNAMLLELFPLGLGSYAGRAYAKEKDDVKAADQPYVCLLATTTLEPLAEALGDRAVYDGTMNRLLFFPQSPGLVRNEQQCFDKIPAQIVDRCKRRWGGSGADAALAATTATVEAKNTVEASGGCYRAIRMTDDAFKLMDSFDRSLDKVKETAGVRAALAARATELAIRVAGVVALGCVEDLDDTEIKAEHMEYGIALVRYSMTQMVDFVDEELAPTNPRFLSRRILNLCKECVENPDAVKLPKDREYLRQYFREGLVPLTVITLKTKTASKRDRDDAVETLVRAGDLALETDSEREFWSEAEEGRQREAELTKKLLLRACFNQEEGHDR